jgi:transposase
MSTYFDGVDDTDDGAFVEIRFQDVVPEGHPAKFIKKFVEVIDTAAFEDKYNVGAGKVGRPPISIQMMLGVILYGIYTRIYSAHEMEKASHMYAEFWIFTHRKRISHDKFSKFIILHKKEIKNVFLETITIAEKNGLLDFKALFQDGFLMKANASIQQCRTIPAMKRRKKKYWKILQEKL